MITSLVKVLLGSGANSAYQNVEGTKRGTITSNSLLVNNVSNHYLAMIWLITTGEMGSGVFNLDGNLIGINIDKEYLETSKTGSEYVLGNVLAVSTNSLLNAIKSVDTNNMSGINIVNDDKFTKESIDTSYNNAQIETAINQVYLTNSKYVVNINGDNESFSGTLYKRVNNKYFVFNKGIS